MTDEPSTTTNPSTRGDNTAQRKKPSRTPVWVSGAVVVVLAIATVIAFSTPSTDSTERNTANTTAPSGPKPADVVVEVGDVVPDIAFELMDGTQTGFADLRGQPLVVNFFASYCTPCVTEMPDFEAVHQSIGNDVKFVGIDVSEPVEAGQRIVDQTGVTYKIGRDPTGKIMRQLGGVAMPTTVFITADGKVAAIHSGQLSAARLEQTINEKLSA